MRHLHANGERRRNVGEGLQWVSSQSAQFAAGTSQIRQDDVERGEIAWWRVSETLQRVPATLQRVSPTL
jgi:hypothetical protein